MKYLNKSVDIEKMGAKKTETSVTSVTTPSPSLSRT